MAHRVQTASKLGKVVESFGNSGSFAGVLGLTHNLEVVGSTDKSPSESAQDSKRASQV